MKPTVVASWIFALAGCYLAAWVGLIEAWCASPFDFGFRCIMAGLLSVLTVALVMVLSSVGTQLARKVLWGALLLGWLGTAVLIMRLAVEVQNSDLSAQGAETLLYSLLALLGASIWGLIHLRPYRRRR